MLLYSVKDSNRLNYTINFLNDHFLKEELVITTNLDLFLAHEGVKINYSTEKLENTFNIKPEGLLFEDDIRLEFPVFSTLNGTPILFNGDHLSSIFYYLSRYEEYQISDRDKHQRFIARHSISAKADLLGTPIVDIWSEELILEIESVVGIKISKNRTFNFLCTFDIDVAYAYKGRSFWRRNGALIKNLIKGNRSFVKEQREVLAGKKTDPYDTYHFQKELILQNSLQAIYFFHLGNWAKYDKQILFDSKEMKDLIEYVSDFAKIGIHPSYRSGHELSKVMNERNRLEMMTGETCMRSRMHFLKLDLPFTYRMLNELGIKEDYTMGFADCPGFRAGTSMSFNFFDLGSNETIDVKLFPLTAMESSFVYYLKSSPGESLVHMKSLIDQVKKVNGNFISLWHNHSLGNNPEWKDWRNLFIEMIGYI